jgi:hypothetical protein
MSAAPKRPYARIAFDMVTKRPGCALIQALRGGFVQAEPSNPASYFSADIWIISNPDLKVYEIETKELFERVVAHVNEFHQAK